MEARKDKGTFIIRISGTENATWQGTISWVSTNRSFDFRSTLELLKIIDRELEAEENER